MDMDLWFFKITTKARLTIPLIKKTNERKLQKNIPTSVV